MARSTLKRKRASSSAQKNLSIWRIMRSAIFLKIAVPLLAIALIFLLREPIGKAIFETFGLGIIPVTAWIAIIAFIVWKDLLSEVRQYWNLWLGALVLTIALLGFMAQFHPDISLAGASLTDDNITLAGRFGHAIGGTSYAWLRLLLLALAGTVLVVPNHSVTFVKVSGSFAWQLGHNLVLLAGMGLWHLTRRLHNWGRSGAAAIVANVIRSRKNKRDATREVSFLEDSLSDPDESVTNDSLPSQSTMPQTATKAPTRRMESQIKQNIIPADTNQELPPIDLLEEAPKTSFAQANDADRAALIEEALASYGVEVKVMQINPGPSVTQFGIEPGWVRKYKRVIARDANGKPKLDKDNHTIFDIEEVSKTRVKVERITSLSNDLALALAVSDIRIEAPMPGKALVGIEVPNVSTAIVSLRSVIESPAFQKISAKSKVALALGLGAGGEAAAGDLAKMPHLLIAGATGSGKSVCLNCIVSCLLAQTTPTDVRLLLIDPKRVEMATFNDVPHLLTPVVVEADKAVDSLRRVTAEMDIRYRKFSTVGVRNIEGYNRSPKVSEPMPYIVVIIDELADLMMTAPDAAEPLICRLAQLARATGIHLIIATQRPSVDVITGLIKANFPTRISFAVVSSIDSRTILDTVGAEKLLGRGDMLYVPPEASKPKRIRGCFVSDEEMDSLVNYWKDWAIKHFPPENDVVAHEFAALPLERLDADPLLEKAKQLLEESVNISASLLQRKLHIGYNRATRILEQLEQEGLLESDDFEDSWEGES